MKLTYIHHSSFYLELDRVSFLFDYTEGDLPSFDPKKRLYIVSTHRHGDHFSPKIFSIAKEVEHLRYLLSFDIPEKKVPKEKRDLVSVVESNVSLTLDDLSIQSFKSTDEGIALLIGSEGRSIYYAGDLNHWHWEGEPDWWNVQMAKNYLAEIAKLPEQLDLAFVPVDPRLGNSYSLGSLELFQHAEVKLFVPMHFWGDFSVCAKLQEQTTTNILQIAEKNQTWRLP